MNRYYDEEELEIPSSNPYLYSNIKVLREEARLSIDALATKMNVSSEDVKNWELGKVIPTYFQVESLCTFLRISHYDIMTRNIKEERDETERKLKSSRNRSNYDWYYGSKKIITLNLIYLIGLPLIFVFLVFFWHLVPIDTPSIIYIIAIFGGLFNYVIAYIGCALISGWIMAITFMIKKRYRFQFWHIFLIGIFITVVELIGIIGTIPYYIYTLVKLITLRGRNHR